jgi:hypothetical protein
LKESAQVLKKAGFITAAAVALSLVAAPAFAATTSVAPQGEAPSMSWGGGGGDCGCGGGDSVGFPEAYHTFIFGGGALGAGAAAVIAGAYTAVLTSPAEVLHSLEHHHHSDCGCGN